MECCFTQARELCRNNYATYNSNILITMLLTFVTAVVLEQCRKPRVQTLLTNTQPAIGAGTFGVVHALAQCCARLACPPQLLARLTSTKVASHARADLGQCIILICHLQADFTPRAHTFTF